MAVQHGILVDIQLSDDEGVASDLHYKKACVKGKEEMQKKNKKKKRKLSLLSTEVVFSSTSE